MSVEVIRVLHCDWCGGEETEDDPVITHRLMLDKQAREFDTHVVCLADTGLGWLIEHGRRPTVAEVAAAAKRPAPAADTRCSICGKKINSMGKGRHATMHERRDNETPVYTDI